MSKQDTYVEKMKLQLDELNAKLKGIEARTKVATHEAEDKYEEEMTRLRDQSKLAGEKLEELRTAAGDSWHKMVADMEKLRHAFTNSFHYFKSQV